MLAPEIIEERQRVLQILEAHQAALAQAGLWPKIWDMVSNGVDYAAESERAGRRAIDDVQLSGTKRNE